MIKRFSVLLAFFLGVLLSPTPVLPGGAAPVQYLVDVRGQQQELYIYPGTAVPNGRSAPVLFAPGDFGMHGVAIDFAQKIASWGYELYCLDSKHYLESFTGKTTLKEAEVMADFRQLARWVQRRRNSSDPILLVGWSGGAGLALLAGASDGNKDVFGGLVLFGLTEWNALGWRWIDYFSYLTNKDPNEPGFRSANYLPRVAPLPLVVIHSSGDQYTSLSSARQMFSFASVPKRFHLVQARNHRFDGNREEFFKVLRASLQWIQNPRT